MSVKRIKTWPERFLELAEHIAGWSKDPSTQVGAVITDPRNRIVSLGFNGLPQSLEDTEARLRERNIKLQMVLHAEQNALMFASKDLTRCSIYVSAFPCSKCAGQIIQSGITHVHTVEPTGQFKKNWQENIELSRDMFDEAGVELHIQKRDNEG